MGVSESPSHTPDALDAESVSGSLRPLLEVAFDEGRISAIARELREAGADGESVEVAVSSPARPFLIAALSEAASAVARANNTKRYRRVFVPPRRVHVFRSVVSF